MDLKDVKIDFYMPKNIHIVAKRYIKTVIEMLMENNLIENVDGAAITMLAVNYSTFIRASEQLSEEGYTIETDKGTIANPLIKIAKDAQVTAMTILKEFGLTAKSRTKLPIGNTEDDSPIAQFINSQKEVR
jgi:P27 family predicted phage terminase small subunit